MPNFAETLAEAVRVTMYQPEFVSRTSGRVFWVKATSAGDYQQFVNEHPQYQDAVDAVYNTIDAAIGACTANEGDVILVTAGHTETVSAASGITADIAGVAIIGLGFGDDRPTITLDTATTADIVVSAASVLFANMRFSANFADIVRCFSVTAKNAMFDRIEFVDTAAAVNFLTPIKATSTTNNNADGLSVTNCKWVSVDAASVEFIEINADLDRLVVEDNLVVTEGTASPLVLCATGKDITYCSIRRNDLSHKMTANQLLVNNDTAANSGIIANNNVGHADVTTTHDLGIDALGCRLFENRSVSTDALSGLLLPAADVNS